MITVCQESAEGSFSLSVPQKTVPLPTRPAEAGMWPRLAFGSYARISSRSVVYLPKAGCAAALGTIPLALDLHSAEPVVGGGDHFFADLDISMGSASQ